MPKEHEHIHPSLRHLAVPIAELNPDPNNACTHGDANREAIRESMRQFGQDQLLVVQKAGMIVRKGNGRLQSAKELGWTHVAVLIVDEGDLDAAARAIADNRTSELSKWDNRVLPKLLKAIEKSKAFKLTAIGFTPERIARMEAKSHAEPFQAVELNEAAPTAAASGIRVMQFFYDGAGLQQFQELSEQLKTKYNLETVGEAVAHAVAAEAKKCEPSSSPPA